jgi:hypothetical protein
MNEPYSWYKIRALDKNSNEIYISTRADWFIYLHENEALETGRELSRYLDETDVIVVDRCDRLKSGLFILTTIRIIPAQPREYKDITNENL